MRVITDWSAAVGAVAANLKFPYRNALFLHPFFQTILMTLDLRKFVVAQLRRIPVRSVSAKINGQWIDLMRSVTNQWQYHRVRLLTC